MLAGLCGGREVIISRGELIEIGGEFRIPDVMSFSGTRLVEVGTTNRTHLVDYEKAITQDTAAILKVHPSNYRVVGFTAEVPGRDLARLARGRGLMFLHDLGSGLVAAPENAGWTEIEPFVEGALTDGADVVTFSGDKLLGGPQAGILAGRSALIQSLQSHPLLRALRVDKMTLAALEETTTAYLEGRLEDLPLWRLAATPVEQLRTRAERLAGELVGPEIKAEAIASHAVAGGGSLPGTEIESWAVAITLAETTPDGLARALRLGEPPVIVRIEGDRVLLDLRAVPETDDPALLDSLRSALFSTKK
jgi:L-seryl-tRNA(Ser) seleniumtransferase